jgi:transposase
MEACATAHYWARELTRLGHEVKLMPPVYVKAYVKRGKTDAADAEAIAEAVTRPTMRFVAVKTPQQQSILALHKVRDLLVRQRTMLINALRGHLGEFGIVAARGSGGVAAAIVALHEAQESLPGEIVAALHGLVEQLQAVGIQIGKLEKRILLCHRADENSRRLATIPGIGPITASAIATTVPDARLFKSGREFAAWLGLTPRAHSSGGKERQVGISKQGDIHIRRLLVVGATAVLRRARQDNASRSWAAKLLERRPPRIVTVALANKTARIAWAVLARKQPFTAPAV